MNIDSGVKLNAALEDHDKRLRGLEKLSAMDIATAGDDPRIGAVLKGWRDESKNDDALSLRLGMFMQAVQRRDEAALQTMGAQKARYSEQEQDMKIFPLGNMKANLGQPLTGDDSEGTGGQYLLPATIYEDLLLRTPFEGGSEVIPRLRNVNMTGRLHRWPTEGTSFSFTFVTNEATDKTEKNLTFSYKDLEAETYAGWLGLSDELVDDTIVDIARLIRAQAIEELQINVIEKQILNSNASPATGILYDASCDDYVIDGTGFADVTWDDLRSTIADLAETKQRRGAVFTMHPEIWSELCDKKDGTGRFYWDPALPPPKTAFGYPVVLSDAMPSLSDSATSTGFIIFGNLRHALHGTRIGLEFRYYDSTMYSVQSDQNFWRVRTRQAFVVGVPANFVVVKTAAS